MNRNSAPLWGPQGTVCDTLTPTHFPLTRWAPGWVCGQMSIRRLLRNM